MLTTNNDNNKINQLVGKHVLISAENFNHMAGKIQHSMAYTLRDLEI